MPGKRGRKKKPSAGIAESAGVTQTTAEIDHAFASEDTGRKRKLPKLTSKQWAIVSIVLIVLLGGGYAIWKNNSSKPKSHQPIYTQEGVKLEKLSDQALQTELQKLIFEKKFSSAEQLINYQDNASDTKLRMLLVATYLNQGKPKDALRILQGIEQKHPNDWRLERMIGDVYQRMGDTRQALIRYKKSLDLLQKSKDASRDDIHFLEQAIKQVGG